ncbi:bromodomain and WD repeat-containing protein 3-like [Antedon mediterranea]|uniref:bromodomain and WD repeat-containing protein 3-like n=1 Tax=Antedon mediterranea TaxID=105859 RepID=UPI003AFA009B
MSKQDDPGKNPTDIERELHFLIVKFLENGPCKKSAENVRRELEEYGLLPQRFDWEGNVRSNTFANLANTYNHIGADHLLKVCEPRVKGVKSLLGVGGHSLLRTAEGKFLC